MKKVLPILLVAGLALFSCAKSAPQAGGEGLTDTITALCPGAEVKTTTPDGTKVFWTDGDKIGMYPSAVYATSLKEPAAQAVFGRTSEGKPTQVGGWYYAVYPSSAAAQWASEEDLQNPENVFCRVTIPTQQTVAPGSWDKKAAVLAAASTTKDFVFRHAASYLRFEITEQTGKFVSVKLSAPGKEKLSDTQAGVRYLSESKLEVLPGASASDYVILRQPDNGVDFAPGSYYMALLPGLFSEGLSLVFTNAEGLVAEKKIAALRLSPGDVVDWSVIGPLDFKEVTTPLEIATVYAENGLNQGVVYWVNPDDPYRGKVVSAVSPEILWSNGLIWTAKIESTVDGLANRAQFNASSVYTDRKDEFYALKYCEDLRESLGGNWYLPAPGELQTLFNAYYGTSVTLKNGDDFRFVDGQLNPSAMACKASYDAALRLLGETDTATLDGDANEDGISDNAGFGNAGGVPYWTSKVNSNGPVQYVTIGVYNLANNKDKWTTTKCYVRCIRDVE